MKISLTNSKLGGQIPAVNLPPVITCRHDAPCCKLCYACKGNFNYKNVKLSHMQNLETYKNNPVFYFDFIINFLSNPLVTYKFFRWHASGDIVDPAYFEGMIRTAAACSDVKFLCFTKKFDIINNYINKNGLEAMPKNLKVIFSAWDKNFIVDNPHNMPVTYINFKDKTQNAQIPPTAIPCTGHCPSCLACWGLHRGQAVVFKQH